MARYGKSAAEVEQEYLDTVDLHDSPLDDFDDTSIGRRKI
jgi:hypothetical protein